MYSEIEISKINWEWVSDNDIHELPLSEIDLSEERFVKNAKNCDLMFRLFYKVWSKDKEEYRLPIWDYDDTKKNPIVVK